jgi:probable HAF family extracellular repeat protein
MFRSTETHDSPRSLTLSAVALATILVVSSTASAQPLYRFTDLGVLPGYSNSIATGLNNSGMVVGSSDNATYVQRAFLWTAESGMIDLGPNAAFDVNDSGTVVGGGFPLGFFEESGGFLWTSNNGRQTLPNDFFIPHEYSAGVAVNDSNYIVISNVDIIGANSLLWKSGSAYKDIGHIAAGMWTEAMDINNQNVIVGVEQNMGGNNQLAFRWTPEGGIRPLANLFGLPNSSAEGINDRGEIVGYAHADDTSNSIATRYAVAWSATGQIRMLRELIPSQNSLAEDINKQGVIVGSIIAGSRWFAVLWTQDGAIYDLNSLLIDLPNGITLTKAHAINDMGLIVGAAVDTNQVSHAFLLTPVPEPAGILLAIIMIGLLTCRRLFQRIAAHRRI